MIVKPFDKIERDRQHPREANSDFEPVCIFSQSDMGRSKRAFLATAEETSSPPSSLPSGHVIAQVIKAEGTYLYSVQIPSLTETRLVELPSRFRSQIWIKRGGYVVVDMSAFDDRENKLAGEIVNIVRNEREWRKHPYWPHEFQMKPAYAEESEDGESLAGKLPPLEESDVEV